MIPITLPPGHRRAVLRSFWTWISLGLGLGVSLLALVLGCRFPVVWGLAIAVALGILSFTHEEFVRRLHGAWNYRLVRPVARLCSRGIMAVCFFIVFVATGRAGSRFAFASREGSGWSTRTSLAPEQYLSPFDGRGVHSNDGWLRSYLRWAWQTGNAWSVSLVPFLWLVRLLSQEEEKAPEANIYTLF